MRLLASLITILLLVMAAGFWTNHSLEETAQYLGQQIEGISQEVKQGEWDAAQRQSQELEKAWKEKAWWWPIILDHQEIDNIEFSLVKAREYIASRNLSLTSGQLSEIKLMIEHIPRKEALNLENIF